MLSVDISTTGEGELEELQLYNPPFPVPFQKMNQNHFNKENKGIFSRNTFSITYKNRTKRRIHPYIYNCQEIFIFAIPLEAS